MMKSILITTSLLLFSITEGLMPDPYYTYDFTYGRRSLVDDHGSDHGSRANKACTVGSYPVEVCDHFHDPDFIDTHLHRFESLNLEDDSEVDNWAAAIAGYYCCKLRSDSVHVLKDVAFEFPKMCYSAQMQAFLEHIAKDKRSFWALVLEDFCPNAVISEEDRRSSHFTNDLWGISLDTPSQTVVDLRNQVLSTCQIADSEGDLVDLTLLFPRGSNDDWQHVVAFWGDELTADTYIDWMPNLSSQSWWTLMTEAEFLLLQGIPGKFRGPAKMNIERGVRLTGLNKDAMVGMMETIAKGNYNLMFNNCAQQVARIAKAGLGCDIREVPFLLPDALFHITKAVAGGSLSETEIQDIQEQLNAVGVDETFTFERLLRRALSTTRRFLNYSGKSDG